MVVDADAVCRLNVMLRAAYLIERAIEGCDRPNWDGYGADTVNRESAATAVRVLQALPVWAPVPEVCVTPDGDVALDWFGEGEILGVGVEAGGTLYYAHASAPDAYPVSGTMRFDGEVPAEILDILRRMTDADRDA